MSADWMRVAQDFLVVLFMFALRVGVPILVLFVVGAWLKKVCEPQATSRADLAKAIRASGDARQFGLARWLQALEIWLHKKSAKRI